MRENLPKRKQETFSSSKNDIGDQNPPCALSGNCHSGMSLGFFQNGSEKLITDVRNITLVIKSSNRHVRGTYPKVLFGNVAFHWTEHGTSSDVTHTSNDINLVTVCHSRVLHSRLTHRSNVLPSVKLYVVHLTRIKNILSVIAAKDENFVIQRHSSSKLSSFNHGLNGSPSIWIKVKAFSQTRKSVKQNMCCD